MVSGEFLHASYLPDSFENYRKVPVLVIAAAQGHDSLSVTGSAVRQEVAGLGYSFDVL